MRTQRLPGVSQQGDEAGVATGLVGRYEYAAQTVARTVELLTAMRVVEDNLARLDRSVQPLARD